MRIPRLLILTVATSLLLTGCGGDDDGSGTASPSPSPSGEASPTAEPSPTPSPSPTSTSAEGAPAYFLSDEPGGPYLTPVWVSGATDVSTAIEAMLAGPEAVLEGTGFSATGLSTSAPEGSELLGIDVTDGVATVDLSDPFDDGGGSTAIMGRLAQLTYTATGFEGIDGVLVAIEGERVDQFSGEGFLIEEPLVREDYLDSGLVPKLFVDHPAYGQTVPVTFTMSGMARDLFEATFVYELSNSADEVFASGPVTAEGSQGWNAFELEVTYAPDEEMPVTLTVVETSAEDGSVVFQRSYPIRIDPTL